MSTFQVRIEDLVGALVSPDTDFLTDSLTDALSELIALLPDSYLWAISSQTGSLTSNGQTVSGNRVLLVERENGASGEYVACKKVLPAFELRYSDVNSIFYPSTDEPVYFLKDEKVYVYPAPAASPNQFQYSAVATQALLYSASTSPIDSMFDSIIVLGASVKVRFRQIVDKRASLPATFTIPTKPTTTLSAPSFSYIPPVVAPSYDDIDTQVSDEDPELAQLAIAKVSEEIGEFSAKIQNELAVFNEQVKEYTAGIGRFDSEYQAWAQDVAADVQKYSSELSNYSFELQQMNAELGALREMYKSALAPYLIREK